MKQPATLIFDIGKTTKKILLFDEAFHVVDEKTTSFPESQDDDGFPSENLDQVGFWVKEVIREYIHHSEFDITHLNFSAYGASLVSLDKDDNLLCPFFNYLKPYPPGTKQRFLSQYDPNKSISEYTASPWLGMLNSGLQAYWLKYNKPKLFHQIGTLLHFPQFFPFLITGKKFCDITSIGCHTMLWDFKGMHYHDWVVRENIDELFPEITPTQFSFAHPLNGKIVNIGTGVHDSSAALMPYLVSMQEPFLLLSTGTWNICFNPFNEDPLTREELVMDCLCFLTYQGKKVKASRIFLGHEHELQQKSLASFFNLDPESHKNVTFDEKLYQRLCDANQPDKEFYPIGMEGSGPLFEKQFRKTNYGTFESFEEAQHQLIRNLAQWQKLSIDLVDPSKKIRNIILVGGFSKSPLFIQILKRELQDRTLLLSAHPRASALGAAWLVHNPDAYKDNKNLLQVIPA